MAEFWDLRGRIINKYGTIKAFADELRRNGEEKSSIVSVSKKLSGEFPFTRDDIETWCRYLDIDSEDISKYFFAQMVKQP